MNWPTTKMPLRDAHGNIMGTFGVSRDITERKRAEEEIQKLNDRLERRVAERTEELEAANKELEAFTYSVSHDLRAPLRHMDGFSKLLVEEHGAELSPDAQEYVATIRESVLQMGRLIDDLLNLARVGRKQLSMQVTGLDSLVEEVMADLKRANPDALDRVEGRDLALRRVRSGADEAGFCQPARQCRQIYPPAEPRRD